MHSSLKRSALGGLALGLIALAPAVARAQIQDLFVANYNDSTISRFAGTGGGTLSTAPTTLSGGGRSHPGGITFDTRGNLFAANSQGDSSTNTPGGTITEFASTGAGTFGVGQTVEAGLSHPQGLAFDARGDLFAANTPEGTITEFVPTGAGTFAAGKTVATGLHNPFGLAFDVSGNLFIANQPSVSGYGTIMGFASTGVGTFAAGTTIKDGLSGPRGLAFDAGGNLFAANAMGNSVVEFAFNPAVGTFGDATTLSDPSGTLNNPVGLAFDARGDLFTANINAGTITEFASTGAGTFGPGTTVETGLNGPTFLAFGPSTPPVPEASTSVSLGLLLALGMGGVVVAARKKRKA